MHSSSCATTTQLFTAQSSLSSTSSASIPSLTPVIATVSKTTTVTQTIVSTASALTSSTLSSLPSVTQGARKDDEKQASSSSAYEITIPSFTNLNDKNTIKRLIQKEEWLTIALKYAQVAYTPASRVLSTGVGGFRFPVNSEILAYHMEKVKTGSITSVYELGGACGDHLFYLALAGATCHLNDLDESTMIDFHETKKKILPKELSQNMTFSVGDGVEEMNKSTKKVDLVYCRNVIHFLNDTKLKEFATGLKAILTPGGEAFISGNAMYLASTSDMWKNYCKRNRSWEKTAYLHSLCQAYTEAGAILLVREFATCQGDLVSIKSRGDWKIYDKKKGSRWEPLNAAYQEIGKCDPSFKQSIADALNDDTTKTTLAKVIGNAKIVAEQDYTRLFSEESLASLFKEYGFEIIKTFAFVPGGHLFSGSEKFGQVQQVGVLIRKPLEKKLD